MLAGYLSQRRTNRSFSDEMLDSNGEIWRHWKKLLDSYEHMGMDAMLVKEREVQRQLRENGVTYNVYGDPNGLNRAWGLDPLPMVFSGEDWQMVEEGLLQRTNLLNLILSDIYGSRTLLRSNHLPLGVIYNHGGFLRQADKIALPGRQQLIHYAADMARGPNGKMWILNDRMDAPSGTGYALENRAAMTRVFPELIRDNRVARISTFYQHLRASLLALSPTNKENPRIVILSPGYGNETYFEHAYLSSFMGFTLAFGQDLTVRDGYVWLRTLRGLEKVDVILRRVDDVYCDPLEFKGESQLGVVGLMEAVRQRKVSVVNPLGCRILENPGLMAFLPSLCREILGEELLLPSVATWWCGQEMERKYVLDNIETLIIKNIYRDHNNHSIYGGELTRNQVNQLRKKILESPHLYVGQESVNFSTTPSLVGGKIEAKTALLRAFVTANVEEETYTVMPGGLARSSTSRGFFKVSNQSGGLSKDAWVIGSKYNQSEYRPGKIEVLQSVDNVLPSRAGENFYWLGRYMERVVYTVRMLRLVLGKFEEEDMDPLGEEEGHMKLLLKSLTYLTATYPGFVGSDKDDAADVLKNPEKELISLALDADRPGTLANSLNKMLVNSYAVRDRLSFDTWRILDAIKKDWEDLQSEEPHLTAIHNALDQLIVKIMAFNGLSIVNMTQEASWRLLNIGRYVESAYCATSILRSILVPVSKKETEKLLMELVLRANESLITYRYRYRSDLQLKGVLELLLDFEQSPRSVKYFLKQLETMVTALPKGETQTLLPAIRKKIFEATAIIQLSEFADLTKAEAGDLERNELESSLSKMHKVLGEISNLIIENYFSHTVGQYGFVKTTRLPDI